MTSVSKTYSIPRFALINWYWRVIIKHAYSFPVSVVGWRVLSFSTHTVTNVLQYYNMTKRKYATIFHNYIRCRRIRRSVVFFFFVNRRVGFGGGWPDHLGGRCSRIGHLGLKWVFFSCKRRTCQLEISGGYKGPPLYTGQNIINRE